MEKQTVLVVGGAGYIGSHICKALYFAGENPVAFDNLIYGHKDFVKWGKFEKGDLLDQEKVCDVIKKYKPGVVFHFAAFAYVGESVTDPEKYYKNNVIGTLNLLGAMKKFGVNKIIFSSTCATYGIPKEIPITETHVQNPINPYGRSKLFIERILKDFDIAYGIKSVVLRYFNAAGADPDCEIGEDHDPETHLIPIALDVALGKRKELCVFGKDYDTKDGTCVRDYIHVSDLAAAHLLALKYLGKENKSNYFNLGNGNGFSVLDVIDSVKRITNKAMPIVFSDRRIGDPDVLVGSSIKARTILQWQPEYDSLDQIVEHAWKWHQKRFD
jgi:UDP-glucose 4-epimerase